MSTKVTLYIAKHNQVNIKYFGKTTKYHTVEELQKYYHGSGVRWNSLLEVYGDDVTMTIYGTYDISEVEEIALKFSNDNNIVESTEWTNLMVENGLSGGGCFGERNGMFGKTHTDEVKEKLSNINIGKVNVKDKDGNVFKVDKNDERYLSGELVVESKGRKWSKEARNKAKGRHSGNNNPKAKRVLIYNDKDELLHDCKGTYLDTIKENGYPKNAMLKSLYNNIKVYENLQDRYIPKDNMSYKGWYLIYS